MAGDVSVITAEGNQRDLVIINLENDKRSARNKRQDELATNIKVPIRNGTNFYSDIESCNDMTPQSDFEAQRIA